MTNTLIYALALLFGFVAGYVTRDQLDALTAHRRTTVTGSRLRSPFTWLRRNGLLLVLGVLIVANLAVGLLLVQQRAATAEFTRCNADYAADFRASYKARTDAASEASLAADRTARAFDQIVRAVDADDSARLDQAVNNYLRVRREQNSVRRQQDIEREANPVPEPPDKLCGETLR